MTWLEENIESGVRDVVKLLRDNGFNTVCSCHHDMTVQCDWHCDGEVQRLHHLLFCHMTDKEPLDYEVIGKVQVIGGQTHGSLEVRLLGRPKVDRETGKPATLTEVELQRSLWHPDIAKAADDAIAARGA